MRTTYATSLLIAFAAGQFNPPPNTTPLEIVSLIDGILIGALDTESVTGLETCIKDFNPLVVDMTKAVHDFEDGSFHAISDGIY